MTDTKVIAPHAVRRALCATVPLEKKMNHDHTQHDAAPRSFWGSRYSIGLIVLGAIAAYFLLSEHRAHFIGALPLLLLLACPLMHVFMHNGHGGHGGGNDHRDDGPPRPDNAVPPLTPKSGVRP